MTEAKPLLGGVELGGTKCVCLIGTGPDDIRVRVSVPTGNDPQATMHRIEEILRDGISVHGPIRALGIASFGPVDLSRQSPTYGCITSTGKPGWRDTPVAAPLGTPALAAPAAAPPTTIWQKLGIGKDQKAACKAQLCATPFGQLISNGVMPLTALSGGMIQPCCPTMPTGWGIGCCCIGCG